MFVVAGPVLCCWHLLDRRQKIIYSYKAMICVSGSSKLHLPKLDGYKKLHIAIPVEKNIRDREVVKNDALAINTN